MHRKYTISNTNQKKQRKENAIGINHALTPVYAVYKIKKRQILKPQMVRYPEKQDLRKRFFNLKMR